MFRATGRFVHTLTDQTLNTNIYGAWLLSFFFLFFFITVVVVVVIVVVYSVLLFMWFMFILPVQ